MIRLLLAVAVLNSHFSLTDLPMVDGHEAVLGFFAISGFYMALILDTGYPSARSFYLSRFLTLYPMYLLALAVSVGLLASLNIHPMTTLARMKTILSDPAGFVVMAWTSICLVGQELLFSLSLSPDGLHVVSASRDALWRNAPLIQAWSLSLEVAFYALAPLLVSLRSRTLAGLAALSLFAQIGILAGGLAEVVFYKRFFPLEFWLFACGILAYRLYRLMPSAPRPFDYMTFVALAAIILLVGNAPAQVRPFALPFAILFSLPFVFRGFRRFATDRYVGRISYPFYLFHFTVIAIFETCMDEPYGWDILATTLAVAVVVYALFTPGIEKLKRLLRRPRVPAAPAGVF